MKSNLEAHSDALEGLRLFVEHAAEMNRSNFLDSHCYHWKPACKTTSGSAEAKHAVSANVCTPEIESWVGNLGLAQEK